MKILIATPLFPPDIGGPATYVFNLANRLTRKGIEVSVLTYGSSLRLLWEKTEAGFEKIEIPSGDSKPRRYWNFYSQARQNSRDADVIYVHDLWSAGLPVKWANAFSKKPLVARLGGDSLWEMALEAGKTERTLPDFYQAQDNNYFYTRQMLQDSVLKACDKVIFSSNFLKDIFLRYRPVWESRSLIIENPSWLPPLPVASASDSQDNGVKTLLFAGRLVKCKNLERLVKVFAALVKIDSSLRLKIVGGGPQMERLMALGAYYNLDAKIQFTGVLNQAALMNEISRAYLCLLLSLGEVSPNFALECLNLKKPLVLTSQNGLPENIKNRLVLVNPASEDEMSRAIASLLDSGKYRAYCETIAGLELTRTWDDVADEHIKLFESSLAAFSRK
ncbi:MAG: glycosyltransferase family 4 protein [Candidatus Pacebacteria bacterium]|nr:glycosyltransferase family 4 protein [Candidatus Paceibacterota bacterium]